MKHLFVGGPANGLWFETYDKPAFFVKTPQSSPNEKKYQQKLPLDSVRYNRRPWVCDEQIVYIYAPEGVSDFVTFNCLLKGFKP